MKKLAIILTMLLLGGQAFCAESAQPEQNFEDNRASISIQKQPTTGNSQKQKVKNNWFCIIIQVNGKINDTDTTGK